MACRSSFAAPKAWRPSFLPGTPSPRKGLKIIGFLPPSSPLSFYFLRGSISGRPSFSAAAFLSYSALLTLAIGLMIVIPPILTFWPLSTIWPPPWITGVLKVFAIPFWGWKKGDSGHLFCSCLMISRLARTGVYITSRLPAALLLISFSSRILNSPLRSITRPASFSWGSENQGCARASVGVIRLSGSAIRSFWTKSLASGERQSHETEVN